MRTSARKSHAPRERRSFRDPVTAFLAGIKPGFPFWPWYGHSIHPHCPECHVFPRRTLHITSRGRRYGDPSVATPVQRAIGSADTCSKVTLLIRLTLPQGRAPRSSSQWTRSGPVHSPADEIMLSGLVGVCYELTTADCWCEGDFPTAIRADALCDSFRGVFAHMNGPAGRCPPQGLDRRPVACLTRQSRCIQEKRGSTMFESEFQIGNSGSSSK